MIGCRWCGARRLGPHGPLRGSEVWYRQELAARGIADGIMASDYRQRPLDAEGHARNRALAALRRPIERSFGVLKRWYGFSRVRYRSLVKNALQLQLLWVALNLRRALALTG